MKTEGNDSGKKYYNSKENNYNYLNVSKINLLIYNQIKKIKFF